MKNRWESRPEPGPGQAQLYWHVLMRDQPQVCALAAVARQRLAAFAGLHPTPERWLHLSVLRVGLAGGIPQASLEAMVGHARERLGPAGPVTATLGPVRYRPEAVALEVGPGGVLDPVRAAILAAAAAAGLRPPGPGPAGEPWLPHVTVAYSTADQPDDPIIAALGRELPAGQITIDSVSLVAQHGPEREWAWQPLVTIPLRVQPAPVTAPSGPVRDDVGHGFPGGAWPG
ncbi:MAG TPA: 2'-5' RNA ligase family protein [Streptosporangiaceae bacterium]|nr:2'-5' RNA ligase family protein [Streptosporangiaceae bacterium]